MVKEKIKYLFWFDTETTGLDPAVHDIIQLAYLIEKVDFAAKRRGTVLVERNLFLRPLNLTQVSREALAVNKRTLEEISEFPAPEIALGTLLQDRRQYLISSADKMLLAGYNVPFDKDFLISLMDKKMVGKFGYRFPSMFYYSPFICVMQAAFSNYVADALQGNEYQDLSDMKLASTAKLFVSSKELEKTAFHDALGDIRLTREIWYRMNGL